jgi:hypothetical protein
VSVNVWPATLIVPVLEPPPFGATLKPTLAAPVQGPVPERVIQETLAVAVQLHDGAVVTATAPAPPSADMVCPAG